MNSTVTLQIERVRRRVSPDTFTFLIGSFWSFIVQVASKGSVLVATLLGARILGVEDFALFVSLQAFALLATSLWDLGFSPLTTREIASGLAKPAEIPARAVRSRLALSWIPIGVVVTAAITLKVDERSTVAALLVMTISIPFTSAANVLTAILSGAMQFRQIAIGNSLGRIGFASSVIVLLLAPLNVNLWQLCLAYALGEAITASLLCTSAMDILESDGHIYHSGERGSVFSVIRQSAPYAISGILILVYNRLDVVIVVLATGVHQAGLYAPASRIQDALMLFPMLAVSALMPIAAKQSASSQESGSIPILRVSIFLGLTITVPAVAVAWNAVPWAISHLLGASFHDSIVPIRILLLSLPFVAIGSPIMGALNAIGHPMRASTMIIVGFAVSVGGTLLLAPHFGAAGAASAAMMREPAIVLVGFVMLALSRQPHA